MLGKIEGKRRGQQMVGWHHWFKGHEFEQTPGDSEGRGSLVCCSPRGHKELDTIEWLNNSMGNQHDLFPSEWEKSHVYSSWLVPAWLLPITWSWWEEQDHDRWNWHYLGPGWGGVGLWLTGEYRPHSKARAIQLQLIVAIQKASPMLPALIFFSQRILNPRPGFLYEFSQFVNVSNWLNLKKNMDQIKQGSPVYNF